MSYEVLVLVDRPEIDPAVLEKLERLVREGATIAGPKPRHASGLSGHPACDATVRQIAERVWANCDGAAVREHAYGKGRVYWGVPVIDILRKRGIGTDFSTAANLDYIHRRDGNRDIYFIRNKSEDWVEAECDFRVAGRGGEVWDAVTGLARPLVLTGARGVSRGVVKLPPVASTFVVFDPGFERNPKAPGPAKVPDPVEIAGPWEIRFPKGWGAPATRTFSRLRSWTEDDDPGVRYFSGVAVYRKTIDIPRRLIGERLYLDLGDVRVIARVRVNGVEAGACWTPPFRVDMTGQAKAGPNLIEVEVANMWSNRLTGDANSTGTRYTHTNIGWSKDTPLLPSGLIGPVRLMPA